MTSNDGASIHNHIIKSNRSKSRSVHSRSVARVLLVLSFFCLLPAPRAIVPDRVMGDGGDIVPTFGAGGIVMTDFAGGNDSANAITATRLGKIIAAGSATIPGQGTDFALACYNRDGSLNSTFGTNGKVTTDFFGGNDGAKGVAVQLDGRIVASGVATNGAERQFAIARYLSDGTLDPTFGQAGKVVLDLGLTSEAFKVSLQADDKIVAVGDSRPQSSLDFTVVRLNQDGSPDNSFGNNGVVRVDFGFTDRAIDLAIDEENIFVCGFVVQSQTNSDMGIARLNISNGSLNSVFDGDGKLTVDFFGKRDGAQAITIREPISPVNERHLLVGGFATPQTSDTTDFALVALDYQGSSINSLFNQGRETVDFNGSTDQVFRVSGQPDGGIVGVGWAGDGANFDLGIAKWDRNGQLDSSWGVQGEYRFDSASGGNNVAFDGILYNDTFMAAGTGLNPATGNDDFILTQHENEKFFEFTKTVSPNPAVKGDIVTYTFTVKNLHSTELSFRVSDLIPEGIRPLLNDDPDWDRYFAFDQHLLSNVFEVPGGETRQITLKASADQTGLKTNSATLDWRQFSFLGFNLAGEAEARLEVKEPEITGAEIRGKKLFLFGSYGSSLGGANLSGSTETSTIEPQASCPVILIDGEEQKTKRDPDNPTTVLIAKKGGKKIKSGQTVILKVRLCDGTETAGFMFTRVQ